MRESRDNWWAICRINDRRVGLAVRLGWQHEFACTAADHGGLRRRNTFTVYGATPQPDSAVVGFSAKTAIAQATQLYLRYDRWLASLHKSWGQS